MAGRRPQRPGAVDSLSISVGADPTSAFKQVEQAVQKLQDDVRRLSSADASAVSTGFTNVADFGAIGDGVHDDTQAIQAALDAAVTTTGVAYIPAGTFIISDTIFVPCFVVLRGTGRSNMGNITASGSFPIDGRPMIRLGRTTESLIFGCRVECLYIEGSFRAGVLVYSNAANEQSGCRFVLASGFTLYGFHFEHNSCVHIEDVEVVPTPAGATTGIFLDTNALTSVISSATLGVEGPLTNGIHIRASECNMLAIHMENCTTGILLDSNSSGLIAGVYAAGGAPNVGTVIRTTGSTHHIGTGLVKNNATTLIDSPFDGVFNSDAYVMLWTSGTSILGGALNYPREDAVAQITANQNDYSVGTQFSSVQVSQISSDAARDITGIVAGGAGRMFWLYNRGAFNITLKHQNAGSTTANRFIGRGNADTVLTPGTSAQLYYSPSVLRWHVMGSP